MSDLHILMLQVLASSSSPVCIFIDGLDEIHEEDFNGHQGLLTLLRQYSSIPNVKLCLGGRPESLFGIALTTYPKLRLQDLTAADLKKHVAETLQEIPESFISEERRDILTEEIVFRADGVFLWVNLVTKSICRGLISYDDWDLLWKRVSQLPNSLMELYQEMLGRINNDDKILYRTEFALYFRTVLEFLSEHEGPTLFEILLCVNPAIRRELFSGDRTMTGAYLNEHFEALRRHLLVRCGGLIGVNYYQGYPQDGTSLLDATVSFIHRSASDFLNDTAEGKQILQHVKRDPVELKIWVHLVSCYCEQFLNRSYRMGTGYILSVLLFSDLVL